MDTEALKKSLLSKFVEVTGDRLQKIQLGVLDLEKPTAEKSAEEVARELHTMKGESRMLGLQAVGQLSHAAEDLLKAHREGKVPVAAAIDLMLRSCDVLSDLLEDLEGAKLGNAASEAFVAKLAETSGHPIPALGPGAKPSRPSAPPPTSRPATVPVVPPRTSAPPTPAASAPPPASTSAPRMVAGKPEEGERAKVDRSIRVQVEILDSLGLLAGDLLVESARAKLRSDELGEIIERFNRMGDAFLKFQAQLGLSTDAQGRAERLEGDLLLLRDDAFRFVRTHVDGVSTLHGSLAKMADNVAEARLVPLSTIFDAFPRMVRDIATEQAKKVELVIDNAGAGVDRSLVADVRDALIHLVRNAVDHGLETPDFREALGKSPTGRVTICVRVDGELLRVTVEDDGRGMDPERLRHSAIQKGILTPAQAQALSEREALELVFRSGFSTRDEVTDLSGRGVGMDVVKKKVETLGGSVSLSSRVGLGSLVSLRLPQSLALMRVLLIRLGDDVYGIPAADVEAVARFRPEDRMEVFGTLAVIHRGKPIALVGLGPLLALNGGTRHERMLAVVVRHGEDRAALVVDGFVDEREVSVKPCGGEFMAGAPFVAGTAALEDGRIAVLLHVPDIMTEVRRMARPVTETQTTKRLKVLLVDDSPIARATESALVKALGHTVDEAQDGEEGWSRLLQQPYDLVISDVQMPKLDGFAFTRRIKAHAELTRIPVIVLSSLAAPEDRRRGLDSGANAYLVKGELGVESLALTIDRLT